MDPAAPSGWSSPRNPLREPFLQFLIVGGLTFGASLLWGEEPVAERELIRVDDGVVTALDARFRAAWNRPPSAEELRLEL